MVVKWKTDIKQAVLKVIREEPEWRFPTIRGIFYYLSDALGIIPATENGYKSLDKLIVQMRKDEEIPFGYFNVERGVSRSTSQYTSPQLSLGLGLNYLLKVADRYEVPAYYDQPYLVEIWIEKKGLINSFERLVGDRITVRSCEGFSPWEFANDAVEDMEDYFDERGTCEVVIFYFGDQDPSGIQIYKSLIDQLNHFDIDYEPHRIGVTIEQIKRLNLPNKPQSPEAMAKIRRDSRYRKYREQFGEIFCELDSLISLAPEDFKTILNDAINKYIDKDKTQERDDLNEMLKTRLRTVLNNNKDEIEALKTKLIEEYEELEE